MRISAPFHGWIVTGLLAGLGAVAGAAEWTVDNVKGSDITGDGSAAKPFETITKALQAAKTSDTVLLTPNPEPYREKIDLPVGGTVEKPFVLDGRGAVIDLLTHYPADKWKAEGNDIFSMPLPNNAHVMDKCWSGFDLVFFDGKPGTNAQSREELQPNGYFLFKHRMQIEGKWHPLHNVLFIRLPAGKTPAEVRVEAPGVGTILHVNKPYVTVRNLTTMYSTQDGLATTRAPGLLFERVRSCYNMDQGISHHGAQVTVRDSRFDHNAGCGIVDVYPEVKVRYERCLVEDDTYRGGVEFHDGEFVMEDCVIRNNPGKALSVARPSSRVTLRNCLLIGREDGKDAGVYQGEGSLVMDRCTLYRFSKGLIVGANAKTTTVTNCAFLACGENYATMPPAKPDPDQIRAVDYNAFAPAPFTFAGSTFKPERWAELKAKTGFDAHSLLQEIPDPLPPWTLPSLKGKGRDGADIGAALDPAKVGLP